MGRTRAKAALEGRLHFVAAVEEADPTKGLHYEESSGAVGVALLGLHHGEVGEAEALDSGVLVEQKPFAHL